MSTQPPSPDSQKDQTSTIEDPKVVEIAELLAAEGVNAERLVVALIGGAEMLIGEFLLESESPYRYRDNFIIVKNPKRLTKVAFQNKTTGEIITEVRFSDFDMINEGYIEISPVGLIFLKRCDDQSKLNYYAAYLGFLEGRKLARARAAGLDVSGSHPNPELLDKLMNKIKAPK